MHIEVDGPTDTPLEDYPSIPSELPPMPPPEDSDFDPEPSEAPAPLVPPPPAPFPAAPASSSGRGERSKAEAFFATAHGRVTYYPKIKNFEARCRFPGHGDCRVTKRSTSPRSEIGPKRHQGRVSACLVAWLELASFDQTHALEHKSEMPSFQACRDARDRLKASGPNGRALLEAERAQKAYETDSEPSEHEPFIDNNM